MSLEQLTDEALWAELRRYKVMADRAFLRDMLAEYDQLQEQVREIEDVITARDRKKGEDDG